ncbi:hypothetical protein GH5_02331 [Leishmania sp. Ghana 2012 LV757]|uniref:hypothetical protein n=1 Tax=Leishmania sp. Ghana 2012 LV757 TaxID=2803181 RepID=UPI001B79FD07|nr:hypothetical protein GH5_02331 [Leishmania sp. Ghana 2012 LV757]
MLTSGVTLSERWLHDAEGLVSRAQSITPTSSLPPTAVPSSPHAGLSSTPPSLDSSAAAGDPTSYGVTAQQLDALSAMAYLVGSPLQRQQPVGSDMTHPALLVAAKLLQRGVDPERIIALIECRHRDAS